MAESYRERILRFFPDTECDDMGTPLFCRMALTGGVRVCVSMRCADCWGEEVKNEQSGADQSDE